jgi:hypothetical protein
MSDAPWVVFRPNDSATEHARDARARAWAFIFSGHAKKKGTRPGAPDDVKESNEYVATQNHSK